MMVPLNVGPGLNTDDTPISVKPGYAMYGQPPAGYVDMDKARFWRGAPQTIGGWETFVAAPVTGVCRNIQPWADLSGVLNVGFGTHSNLEVYVGGTLYDITPLLALPALTLGANPLTTLNTSTTVAVAQNGHPYIVGDVNTLSGAADTGGILAANLNGARTVTAITTNTWSFVAGAAASSGVTGGGSAIVVTPQRAFAAGAIDGTGGLGFGAGAYSVGGYSQPSTADYFPRTWALANFGQQLIANPRGGPIYAWANATGTPAAPLMGGPARVTHAIVTPERQVVAFGCNEVASGVYDPMNVRGCDLEDDIDWIPTSANNAWEEKLEGGGRLVAGEMVGDFIFAWSDTCLWQAQFVGDPGQTYRFTRLGDNCGLIGPNAKEVVGQTAYWMGTDGNFRSCSLNGTPTLIPSPVQTGVFDNLAPGQQDKIIAAEIPKFGEIWWFYPDARDGVDISRYVGLSTLTGLWFHGTFDRTAFHAGGPAANPIAVNFAGNAYYHEKGQTADGGPISYFWETGAQYLGNMDQRFQIKTVFPDFQGQVGPVSLSVYMRAYPQDTDRAKGPFMLSPNQSKRDFLADGRLARIRVAGNSSPAFCRQGRPQFDADASGMQ